MRRGPNFTGPWYVDDKVAQRFALRDRIPREQQTPESECAIDPARLGPFDNGELPSILLFLYEYTTAGIFLLNL